jgi:hypothetical protein
MRASVRPFAPKRTGNHLLAQLTSTLIAAHREVESRSRSGNPNGLRARSGQKERT